MTQRKIQMNGIKSFAQLFHPPNAPTPAPAPVQMLVRYNFSLADFNKRPGVDGWKPEFKLTIEFPPVARVHPFDQGLLPSIYQPGAPGLCRAASPRPTHQPVAIRDAALAGMLLVLLVQLFLHAFFEWIPPNNDVLMVWFGLQNQKYLPLNILPRQAREAVAKVFRWLEQKREKYAAVNLCSKNEMLHG